MARFELSLPTSPAAGGTHNPGVLAGHHPAVPLGEAPISVGRAPGNGVVLTDDSVSWHHAQLWLEGDVAWLRDLGSRNGTFLNGERVVASTRLKDGDEIRLGATVTLGVRAHGVSASHVRLRHVEDLSAGVRVPVLGSRFLFGAAPGSDLRVDEWPPRAATLLIHADGELWLGTDDGEQALEVGAAFEVLGRKFKVVEELTDHAPTVDIGGQQYPYTLRAWSDGAGDPMVTLSDGISGRELVLSGNRGILLFALTKQFAKDRARGLADAEQGWRTTEEAIVAVWGRGKKDANHLNVLVHRLRGHLTEAGFDPWFVEKRRGGIRVRVGEANVAE